MKIIIIIDGKETIHVRPNYYCHEVNRQHIYHFLQVAEKPEILSRENHQKTDSYKLSAI
jgi:hypothetical protein